MSFAYVAAFGFLLATGCGSSEGGMGAVNGQGGLGGSPAAAQPSDAPVAAPTVTSPIDTGTPAPSDPLPPTAGAPSGVPADPVPPVPPDDDPPPDVGQGDPGAPVPSIGCGEVPAQQAEAWIEAPLTVDGVERRWWTYLPANYDPERAYPIVMVLHGCGDENNNLPMEDVTGEDAVLVRGVAQTDCWDLGANSPDILFFDAMVSMAEASLCIDMSRIFAVGYSSGSWLINRLDCLRGDVLRAAGSVAGGTPGGGGGCVGSVARMFVHDENDPENLIAGSITERDRLIELNGCDTAQPPVAVDPPPCVEYQGCDPENPVVWCQTMGLGHSRQDNQAGAFWSFLSRF